MKIQLNDWIVTGKQAKPILRAILVLNIGFYIFIYNIKRGGSLLIEKIINNNVITTILEEGQEAVIMGNGIGFKKRIGEMVDDSKIEKLFKIDNNRNKKKFIELLQSTSPDYFILTEKIVKYAENQLDKTLSELIYVLMTDHIVFAIQREKDGLFLPNPMLWEIKNLYKDEFNIGLWSLQLIKETFNITLPEDEAAFIALHIVNASLGEEMYNTMNITILTKNILKIIKNHFLIEFNEDSLDYIRLVTHLKFFSQRLFKREQVVNEDEDLYEILKDKYPKENECVEKIRKFIEREFNYCIIMQEKIYLIMHIKKVTKKG